MGLGEALAGAGEEKASPHRPGDQSSERPLEPQDGKILGMKDP